LFVFFFVVFFCSKEETAAAPSCVVTLELAGFGRASVDRLCRLGLGLDTFSHELVQHVGHSQLYVFAIQLDSDAPVSFSGCTRCFTADETLDVQPSLPSWRREEPQCAHLALDCFAGKLQQARQSSPGTQPTVEPSPKSEG
jgi:hypothetical protein